MSTSFKQQLNIIPRFYKKLIYGEYNLSKPERVYAKFNISPGEEIIAYIPSGIPFTAPSVVITDCSLYSTMEGPFPHSRLCGYVIWQADEKAPVTLSDAVSDHAVLGGSLLSKNLPGQELVRFIHEFQERLVRDYPWAREQRDKLVRDITEAAKADMRSGQISDLRLSLLNVLAQEPEYLDPILFLKAENVFRTYRAEDYQSYLDNLPLSVPKELKSRLSNSEAVFTQNLIRDFSDTAINFSPEYLHQVYGNLSSLNEYSEDECMLLAYVCIRLGKAEQLNTVLGQIRRRFGNVKADRLEFFQGRYCNGRMRIVYEAILHDQAPSKEQYGWTDSLGLTPLHYAILLKKEDAVERLLHERDWRTSAPVADTDEAGSAYDYSLIACCVGYPNRELVFQETSDMVATQRRAKKALERRRWLKERKLDLQRETARQSRNMIKLARQNGLSEKVYEYQEKLDVQKELQRETQEEINEIDQSIHEIEYEINELTRDSLIAAADTLQQLKGSNNPFVRLLMNLYSDSGLFQKYLFDSGEYRIYSYGSFTFAAPASIDIPLPYRDEATGKTTHTEQKQSTADKNRETKKEPKVERRTNEPIRKPYGDSWFSPKAHRNLIKLKKEFWALAKQYHPDCCQHVRSKEIFQEILSERMEILERME